MFKDQTKLYIKSADIQKKCKDLGKQISRDYKGKDLVLIAVLKGSIVFFSDLIRYLDIPCTTDFVKLSSYGHGTETSGKVTIHQDVSVDLKNKHVIVIEDILDTGLTLTFFTEYLKKYGAASVKICTLLDKPSRRRTPIEADYCGFKIDDHFVVGYGLDYQEICRNYPDIYQVTHL